MKPRAATIVLAALAVSACSMSMELPDSALPDAGAVDVAGESTVPDATSTASDASDAVAAMDAVESPDASDAATSLDAMDDAIASDAGADRTEPDAVDDAVADAALSDRDASEDVSRAECMVDDDCSDRVFCNGVERCAAGRCAAGVAPTCDDGVACTTDRCDRALDRCVQLGPDADRDGHIAAACGGDDCDDVDALRRPSAPERCDGVDNDCDTMIDEGVLTTFYTDADGDGVGAMASPVQACARPMGAVSIAGDCDDADRTRYPGAAERCDGRDNNCDGTTDPGCSCTDGATRPCGTSAVGACLLGAQRCADGVWGSCVGNVEPAIERCNGVDDDCNGAIDNGFASAGRYDQLAHCGRCFNDCAALWTAAQHVTALCDGAPATPVCGYACQAGYLDLDGIAANGCEHMIDASAVFVSASTGADLAACGALASPCRTITFGVSRARTIGAARVRVSEGYYRESVALEAGVALLGGHNASSWSRNRSAFPSIIAGVSAGGADESSVTCNGLSGSAELNGFVVYAPTATAASANTHAVLLRNCGGSVRIEDNLLLGGRAGAGATGSAGAIGASGSVGANGANGAEDATCADNTSSARDAASGGTGLCSGAGTQGGAGGRRACPNYAVGVQGNGGAGSRGAAGGGGASDRGVDSAMGCAVCSLSAVLPRVASNGDDGVAGSLGSGGPGCTSSAGAVVSGRWTGASGATGATGSAGGGGGGGGAGAGLEIVGCAGNNHLGGGGGGGGAGGCGGSGGLGGGSGGGSFALSVVFTSSPASLPVVRGNEVHTGVGGAGGSGGPGGVRGSGASGGRGGLESAASALAMVCTGAGGAGGRGGDGGHGGGGGGGCGGVSYGVFLSGQGALDPTIIATSNVVFVDGAGGTGGVGGLSLGNAGSAGSAGASAARNF
jgi:hypothetical protein